MVKKILSTFLSLSLCGGSLTLAADNPGAPQPAPDSAAEASGRVAAEIAAAIQALGANPARTRISTIVFKVVRSKPDSVLPIVDAAVRVSPLTAAPEIVMAATAAVPNPWKHVIYRRLATLNADPSVPDGKNQSDGKQVHDGKRFIDLGPKQSGLSIGLSARVSSESRGGDPGATSANGIEMTLAEAIVRTAFDARAGLSFTELQDAANAALRMDPETLMRYIQSPRASSGVGDAGLSNYSNEPVLIPKPPVVSR